MKQTTNKYAEMLTKLQIPKETVTHTTEIFLAIPQVKETLADPGISLGKKHDIIEKTTSFGLPFFYGADDRGRTCTG